MDGLKYTVAGCVAVLILSNPEHRRLTRHALASWPDAAAGVAVVTTPQAREVEPPPTLGRRMLEQNEVVQRLDALPLGFERNVGQAAPEIDAIAHGRGYSLSFGAGEQVLAFAAPGNRRGEVVSREVRMSLPGRDPRSGPVYGDELPGVSNYLVGDRSAWRTGVRSYATVQYNQIYPGIDLVFYGRDGDLEYDFVVAPGADPDRIRFEIEGADDVRVGEAGALDVRVGDDAIALAPPVVYQRRSDGHRQTVEGTYRLEGTTVRFALGRYDPAATLVIDPVFVYSTQVTYGPYVPYTDDYAGGVASDALGNGYFLGTMHARWGLDSLVGDMVVAKLNPTGALVYKTFLGTGHAAAIAVSPAGEVFVAGKGSFPDVPGFRGWGSNFSIVKLNAAGNAIYRATIGNDISLFESLHLAVGPAGQAALTGATGPGNFTLENAVQPVHGGGGYDAFALVVNPAGDQLMFSTYVGGSGLDVGHGIAIHEDGAITIVGRTSSPNFPTFMPLQPALAGPFDGFVTTFTAAGTIAQSTFLGGSGTDAVRGVGIGPAAVVHVAGKTDSLDFPVKSSHEPGGRTAFLTRLAADGSSLLYSTYFGGTGDDTVGGVATDAEGNTYVAGSTTSTDFPLRLAMRGYGGGVDGFVVKFGAQGDLLHSSYAGVGVGPAVDPAGNVFVGTSYEPYGGNAMVFLDKLGTALEVASASPAIVPTGTTGRVTFTGRNFANGARLFIGGQWAPEVTVNSVTSLTATLPLLPAGTFDVVVVNPSPYNELAALRDAVQYSLCSFTLPVAQEFTGEGGTRSIAIQSAPAGCGWSAETTEDWISIDPSAESGFASVRITVSPNPTRVVRFGTLRVAGQIIGIRQGVSAMLDLDFDGRLDLIWQHQTDGRLATWLMNGTISTSGEPLQPPAVPDTSWKVVGSADLDGDGYSDLVWQNIADGRIAAWLMTGLTSRDGLLLTPGQVDDTGWRIRAVGDFDADGKADLIWQHETRGLVAVWIMNGLQLVDGRLLSPDTITDLSWRIVGSGDFNHDGYRDLVWHHQGTGHVSVWLMNGTTMVSTVSVAPDSVGDTDWKIRAVGDLDGDGQPDLIWQHQVNGGVCVWLMDGLTRRAGEWLTPREVSDTNWHIVGPR